MTHNGLKVRINHDFCLRNIREENITPWYTSIEAFDSLRGLLAIICTIIMMFMHEEPIYTGILIIASYLFGYLVSQSYSLMVLLNMVYGLLYMLYSILSKYFIQYIVLIVIAIIKKEYFLLLSYICARLICFIIMSTINALRGRYYLISMDFILEMSKLLP